jgi:hypothetical protein
MWQTPKTNWVATDPVSYIDYNRIVGNLNELQTLCQEMYTLTATDLGNSQTVSDYPYEDMLNAIETALANVNSASFDFAIGTGVVFVANGDYFDFTELNRIESASLRLYNWLNAQFEAIPRLSIRLGNRKGIKP